MVKRVIVLQIKKDGILLNEIYVSFIQLFISGIYGSHRVLLLIITLRTILVIIYLHNIIYKVNNFSQSVEKKNILFKECEINTCLKEFSLYYSYITLVWTTTYLYIMNIKQVFFRKFRKHQVRYYFHLKSFLIHSIN